MIVDKKKTLYLIIKIKILKLKGKLILYLNYPVIFKKLIDLKSKIIEIFCI